MQRYLRTLTASAVILAAGAVAASAHQSFGGPMMQQGQPQITQPGTAIGPGMMGSGTAGTGIATPGGTVGPGMMMGPGMMGMMGPGMMGYGATAPGMMGSMRMMVILMDADGDGAVSLEEFQAVQARMFKAMDTDGDGRLTLEEAQSSMMPQASQAQ